MEDDKEVKRYSNIDIPDSLKELEVRAFQFDVTMDRKITSLLLFDGEILTEDLPPAREKMTRAEKTTILRRKTKKNRQRFRQ